MGCIGFRAVVGIPGEGEVKPGSKGSRAKGSGDDFHDSDQV